MKGAIRALALLAALLSVAACAPGARPPTDRPLRVVVISDLNGAYGSTAYAAEVAAVVDSIVTRWRPDAVLAAGDLVAGQKPSLPDDSVRAMWAAFDAAIAAPLRAAGIPLLVTLGNHDGSAYPAHARDRALAGEFWRDPARRTSLRLLDDADFPYRYTARLGDVFVAVWDATRQESTHSDTLRLWLRDALRGPAARSARHRVVLGHLPLYAVAQGRDRPGEVLAGGDAFRRALERWGATLYVSGHHHAYFPGRRGGLELLHAGALGSGPRPLLAGSLPRTRTVTLLEFEGDTLRESTWAVGPDGALSPIPLPSLPPLLCGHTGPVARRDLSLPGGAC